MWDILTAATPSGTRGCSTPWRTPSATGDRTTPTTIWIGTIALGFRRLSIIDLEGGRQPILNEDGTKVLTFNGEIYNYQDIKKDLLAAGHVFKTATDSEVLLHGYEEYGTQLLNKLRGMFALSSGTRRSGSSLAPGTSSASSPCTTPR